MNGRDKGSVHIEAYIIYRGITFLKKSYPPNPLQKTFKSFGQGVVFL